MTNSTQQEQQRLQKIIQTSRGSLIDHYRLYHASDANYVKPAAFHYKISDILLKEKDNFAIEAFRESAKSSLVLLDYPTYLMQFPVEELSYIVIIKQNQSLAEEKLKEIVEAYLENPILRLNLIKVEKFAANTFIAKLKGLKGETIQMKIVAYGKGSSLRGLVWGAKRPQLMIIDDPQDFEDSRSETALTRDWQWFMSDVKMLSRTGRIFMIGNNLGAKCIIERIFEDPEPLNFKTMKIKALQEDGTATWNEQFTKEFLEDEKITYRKNGQIDIWYRERMCEAISDESRDFPQDNFKYYDKTPPLCVKIAVDPAISQKQTADNTGICVAGISTKNDIYILETVMKKMKPDEIIDNVFNLLDKWEPYYGTIEVGLEVVAYQKMLIYELQKQMKLRNRFFNLREIRPMGEKEARIRASLQARYKAKTVYHKPHMTDLENELLEFPVGKHDDLCLVGGTLIKTTDGDVPIEKITNSHKLVTPLGVSEVVWCRSTGIKGVIDRIGITGTPDHKVFTPHGYLSLDRVGERSSIGEYSLTSLIKWNILRLLLSREPRTGLWGRVDITCLNQLQMKEGGALSLCMSQFGKMVAGKEFQKTAAFTISMATALITALRTWTVLKLKNMLLTTPKKGGRIQRLWKGLRSILTRSGIRQKLGMQARKVESGTGKMVVSRGKEQRTQESLWRNVLSVAKSLKHTTEKVSSAQDSVLVGTGERIIEKECKITTEEGGLKEVYSLKTELGTYYANGYLVANCDATSFAVMMLDGKLDREKKPLTYTGGGGIAKVESDFDSAFEKKSDEIQLVNYNK